MNVKERKENEGLMVEVVEGGEVKAEERREGRRVKGGGRGEGSKGEKKV